MTLTWHWHEPEMTLTWPWQDLHDLDMTLTPTDEHLLFWYDLFGKRPTTKQQYNTTKQQTQDYETTRRRYATRRLKIPLTLCNTSFQEIHRIPLISTLSTSRGGSEWYNTQKFWDVPNKNGKHWRQWRQRNKKICKKSFLELPRTPSGS